MKFFVKGTRTSSSLARLDDSFWKCHAWSHNHLVRAAELGSVERSHTDRLTRVVRLNPTDEGVQSRQAWIGNQMAVQQRRVRCLACQWLLAPSLVLYMTTRQRGLSHHLMT